MGMGCPRGQGEQVPCGSSYQEQAQQLFPRRDASGSISNGGEALCRPHPPQQYVRREFNIYSSLLRKKRDTQIGMGSQEAKRPSSSLLFDPKDPAGHPSASCEHPFILLTTCPPTWEGSLLPCCPKEGPPPQMSARAPLLTCKQRDSCSRPKSTRRRPAGSGNRGNPVTALVLTEHSSFS